MTLDSFFHPKGIAIIGATDNALKGGFHILRNTLAGYRGPVYPVHPRLKEILSTKCYPDVDSIPENFELAIYFIPARHLPSTIESCAKKGARAVIIESAGFSEVGDEGRRLQEDSLAAARRHGIRLWGPNCMGLLDGYSRNVFSFMFTDRWKTLMQPGEVSLIVQSGMLSAGFLMMILERGGMGIAKVCSIGNKCDVHETELLEYMVNDPETKVIACYLESIVDGRKFLELARSTEKPVIVLKAGRSDAGAKAALSHTASLSGAETVYRGAFRQSGIIRVYDLHELMDFARGFSKIETCPLSGGTAVVTFSGGAGIVTADLLSDNGISLAELSSDTLEAMKEFYPSWMQPAHPLDLWPAVEQNGLAPVYLKAAEALMKDDGVDSILLETFAWELTPPDFLTEIGAMKKRYGKPVVLWITGGSSAMAKFGAVAEEAGMPVFFEIGRCAAFLAGIKGHFAAKRKLTAGRRTG